MHLIAIHGGAGSGKDLFADWLVEKLLFRKAAFAGPFKEFLLKVFPQVDVEHVYGASAARAMPFVTDLARDADETVIKYATRWAEASRADVNATIDALKRCIWGFTSRSHVTVREALQTLGSEFGRSIHPDLWVNVMFRQTVPTLRNPAWFGWHWTPPPASGEARVVIHDVRFANEVTAIRRLWPCDKAHIVKLVRERASVVVGGIAGHASEAGLPDDLFDLVCKVPEGLERLRHYYDAIWKTFLDPLI